MAEDNHRYRQNEADPEPAAEHLAVRAVSGMSIMVRMPGIGVVSDVGQMLSVPGVGICVARRWALCLAGVLVLGGSRLVAGVSLLRVGHHNS